MFHQPRVKQCDPTHLKTIYDFKNVAVVSSKYKPKAHPTARAIADHLQNLGIGVFLDLKGTEPLATAAKDVELVFCIGGDGTILSTARRLAGVLVPTLGVNMGKLGFLAEHSIVDTWEFLQGKKKIYMLDVSFLSEGQEARAINIPKDVWKLNSKMMLELKLYRPKQAFKVAYALNDITVSQGVMTRLIDIDMTVDGHYATQYRADGVIVSSPVGSTGYALSLGGPILTQGLRVLMVTPIAPHALTNRTIAIEASATLGFRVTKQINEVALVVDGQERIDLQQGDYFTIAAAPTDFMIISSDRHTYYDILRQKLGWGTTPLQHGSSQD